MPGSILYAQTLTVMAIIHIYGCIRIILHRYIHLHTYIHIHRAPTCFFAHLNHFYEMCTRINWESNLHIWASKHFTLKQPLSIWGTYLSCAILGEFTLILYANWDRIHNTSLLILTTMQYKHVFKMQFINYNGPQVAMWSL